MESNHSNHQQTSSFILFQDFEAPPDVMDDFMDEFLVCGFPNTINLSPSAISSVDNNCGSLDFCQFNPDPGIIPDHEGNFTKVSERGNYGGKLKYQRSEDKDYPQDDITSKSQNTAKQLFYKCPNQRSIIKLGRPVDNVILSLLRKSHSKYIENDGGEVIKSKLKDLLDLFPNTEFVTKLKEIKTLVLGCAPISSEKITKADEQLLSHLKTMEIAYLTLTQKVNVWDKLDVVVAILKKQEMWKKSKNKNCPVVLDRSILMRFSPSDDILTDSGEFYLPVVTRDGYGTGRADQNAEDKRPNPLHDLWGFNQVKKFEQVQERDLKRSFRRMNKSTISTHESKGNYNSTIKRPLQNLYLFYFNFFAYFRLLRCANCLSDSNYLMYKKDPDKYNGLLDISFLVDEKLNAHQVGMIARAFYFDGIDDNVRKLIVSFGKIQEAFVFSNAYPGYFYDPEARKKAVESNLKKGKKSKGVASLNSQGHVKSDGSDWIGNCSS